MRLAGKNVLITGAAVGIGKAIAQVAAREGASVMLGDIAIDGAQANAAAIREAGGRAEAVALDVTEAASAARAVAATVDAFGSIDGLVNNAGLLIERSVVDTTEDEWDRVLAVNLKGPWLMCRAAIPKMLDAGGGSIVNMGSIESLVARPDHSSYGASKGGLLNFTRAVAVEYGRQGIRCNTICPGSIDTEMWQRHVAAQPDPEQAYKDLVSRNFAGRPGTGQEVGWLAVYLLSDESGFTNGAHHVIDGARIAHT